MDCLPFAHLPLSGPSASRLPSLATAKNRRARCELKKDAVLAGPKTSPKTLSGAPPILCNCIICSRACVGRRVAGSALGAGSRDGGVLSFEPQEKKLSCQKRNFRISVILIKTFTAHVEQDTFSTEILLISCRKNKVSYHVFLLLLLVHEVYIENQEPRIEKSDWSIQISYALMYVFHCSLFQYTLELKFIGKC